MLLIEREDKLGGILKQCIHDGFGLAHFKERLTGPEYAQRFINELQGLDIDVLLSTTVLHIEKKGQFYVEIVNEKGIFTVVSNTLVLSTGCRERTSKQIFIHGERPAGIYSAGSAQYFMNVLGHLPTRRCVILGSGDIGLIMARRLTLEGAKVLGVYEAKPTPSGLTRNILQCLKDYEIPLHLSHTVTRVFGGSRLEGVEITKVDAQMKPIPGTAFRVDCDALIISVGLSPENELAEKLSITLDPKTKGPYVDQSFMTGLSGCFICGNALHVNDLVDHVSHCASLAGKNAALYKERKVVYQNVETGRGLAYFLPQRIHYPLIETKIPSYFRVNKEMKKGKFKVKADHQIVFEKVLTNLKPPEMEYLELDCSLVEKARRIEIEVEELK